VLEALGVIEVEALVLLATAGMLGRGGFLAPVPMGRDGLGDVSRDAISDADLPSASARAQQCRLTSCSSSHHQATARTRPDECPLASPPMACQSALASMECCSCSSRQGTNSMRRRL